MATTGADVLGLVQRRGNPLGALSRQQPSKPLPATPRLALRDHCALNPRVFQAPSGQGCAASIADDVQLEDGGVMDEVADGGERLNWLDLERRS
jgi:hypothetical protein